MQTKIKLSVILLSLIIISLTPLLYANAMTFDMRIPSYGLYCEDKNADMHGKVKYEIDGEGKAIQHSEYSVGSGVYYLPFISTASDIPGVDILINGKAVTKELRYGGRFNYDDEYIFYPCELDESITGTLYTLKSESDTFTVSYKTDKNQKMIYLLTNSFAGKSDSEKSIYTFSNAVPDAEYHIFIVNGDFSEFETSAQVTKKTISFKEYINSNYGEYQKEVNVGFYYSVANYMLDKGVNFGYFDFFFDSLAQMRYSAYRIETQSPCTVTYSMPVKVQKNSAFNPAIYMAEQNSTCPVDYTLELNENLPNIIESCSDMQREGNTYTASNREGNFYFVFSSSKKPKSIYEKESGTWKIVLIAVAGCIALLAIGFGVFVYLRK